MAKAVKGRVRARDGLVRGEEVPSNIPVAPPVGYKREPTMVERIRAMVVSEHVRLAAMNAGAETFDEADDFDVGDDYDPASPYEEVFEPVDYEARTRLRNEEYESMVAARTEEIVEHGSPKHRQARKRRTGDGSGDTAIGDKSATKADDKSAVSGDLRGTDKGATKSE